MVKEQHSCCSDWRFMTFRAVRHNLKIGTSNSKIMLDVLKSDKDPWWNCGASALSFGCTPPAGCLPSVGNNYKRQNQSHHMRILECKKGLGRARISPWTHTFVLPQNIPTTRRQQTFGLQNFESVEFSRQIFVCTKRGPIGCWKACSISTKKSKHEVTRTAETEAFHSEAPRKFCSFEAPTHQATRVLLGKQGLKVVGRTPGLKNSDADGF